MTKPDSFPKLNAKILDEFQKALAIQIWLQDKTEDATVPKSLRPKLSGLALTQQSLESVYAILKLVNMQLNGSAWMLCRPAFETYVRGVWLIQTARPSEIKQAKKRLLH